ncbi:Ig-like domain-containing protein [Mycetocola saprophilus]|uniref:Ig-like domain-containing protein n=1 Tax=Mycetocola saprophilus TaxID=76636 RepID=UPI003BF45AE1
MTFRKTLTTAALCTVALGSFIAQPAFASTLTIPASTSAGSQTQSGTIAPGAQGQVSVALPGLSQGVLHITAPAGTTIVNVNQPGCKIAADEKTAECGSNLDSWGGFITVTLKVDADATPGAELAGGSVAVSLHGTEVISKDLALTVSGGTGESTPTPTPTPAPSPSTPTTPETSEVTTPEDTSGTHSNTAVPGATIAPGETGIATVAIPGLQQGKLKVTAPVGTSIVSINQPGCVIAADALSAQCGSNLDSWGGFIKVTLKVDASVAVGTVLTGGSVVVESFGTPVVGFDYPVTVINPANTSFPAANSTINDTKPTFAGTGEPGAAIRVFGTSRTVATATVGTDGKWSAPSDIELIGGFKLNVEQTGGDGESKSVHGLAFTVTKNVVKELAMTSPKTGDTVTNKRVTFTGTGTAGAKIAVLGSSRALGYTTVGADGTWSITAAFDLANGGYKLRVLQNQGAADQKEIDLSFTVKS